MAIKYFVKLRQFYPAYLKNLNGEGCTLRKTKVLKSLKTAKQKHEDVAHN